MIRFLTLIICLPFLFAFNFSPMSQTIEVEGKRNGAQFLIENDSSTNIAVELTVKSRQMNENGEETLSDTKEVTIFPPQIIIPPNEKRTVRVTYNVKDVPETEKSYRVIAEQLPLKVDEKTKNEAGIKMLMKYVAALYAAAPNTKSGVKLLSHASDGKEMKLVIENKGQRHQLINNPIIKYLSQDKKVELKSQDLPGLSGENVLAGHKRIFRVKTSKTIPQDAKVELKIND